MGPWIRISPKSGPIMVSPHPCHPCDTLVSRHKNAHKSARPAKRGPGSESFPKVPQSWFHHTCHPRDTLVSRHKNAYKSAWPAKRGPGSESLPEASQSWFHHTPATPATRSCHAIQMHAKLHGLLNRALDQNLSQQCPNHGFTTPLPPPRHARVTP